MPKPVPVKAGLRLYRGLRPTFPSPLTPEREQIREASTPSAMADYHLTVLTRFSVQLPSIAHIVQAGESPPNELDQASLDLPLPVSVGRTVSRQAPALEPGVLDIPHVILPCC